MKRSAYKHQIFWQLASFALANVEVGAKEIPKSYSLPLCYPSVCRAWPTAASQCDIINHFLSCSSRHIPVSLSCYLCCSITLFASLSFVFFSLSSLLLPLSLSPIDSLNKPQKFYNFIMLFFPCSLSIFRVSPSLFLALPLPAYP